MKKSLTVFLTSLAVSAISLTVPLPAASTVLNLFIGEEIAVQDTPNMETECPRRAVPTSDGTHDTQTATSTNDLQEAASAKCVFSVISDIALCIGKSSFIRNAVSLYQPGSTLQEL